MFHSEFLLGAFLTKTDALEELGQIIKKSSVVSCDKSFIELDFLQASLILAKPLNFVFAKKCAKINRYDYKREESCGDRQHADP